MRFCIALALTLAVSLSAQTQKPKSKPILKAPPAKAIASSPTPSEAEVNEFLRRMFGYDSNVRWAIQGIVPTSSDGVSHVIAVASVGGQQRPIHLYVLPGGKFAVAGEYIPFGTDPFAPVRSTLATKATGVHRGPADSAVTLVEFSDLQCPFCRTAQPIIDRLAAEVPNTRLIFQPFPLPMHQWAMKAAAHAECVARQDNKAFWEFMNGVYTDQANIADANVDAKLAALATSTGVDAAKVAACSGTPEIATRIQQSIELGRSAGVNSTPTLFINGRRITGIADMPYEQLKAMVEFEAAEARKQK